MNVVRTIKQSINANVTDYGAILFAWVLYIQGNIGTTELN
jgi:hypothetical protein